MTMNRQTLVAAMLFLIPTTILTAQESAPTSAVTKTKSTVERTYRAPTVTLRGDVKGSSNASLKSLPPQPVFCDPNCLYYSGDFDPSGPNPQGQWSGTNGTDIQDIWHAFVPGGSGTYLITGASVNIVTNETGGGVASIPYSINTGVSTGNSGTVVCSGDGNVTMTPYGTSYQGLNQYNYSIAINNPTCQVNAGTSYWLDVEVQYSDNSGLLYELDVEDNNPANAYGWASVLDETYSNSSFFGDDGDDTFENTSVTEGPCDGFGCDLFSFSISGTPVLSCSGGGEPVNDRVPEYRMRRLGTPVKQSVRENKNHPASLPFCSPNNCLYYSGDFDSTDSNANGLFNANDTGASLLGQTWVGVLPTENAIVTGGTFNEFLTEGVVGSNPTPFCANVGMSSGNPGVTVCSTSGTATAVVYGESDFGLVQYSYTIQQLATSCQFSQGTTYYVNLLPIYSDGYGYVANVEDDPANNQTGWPNDLDNCFFNGSAFGAYYVPCNTQGTFDELSIALTGSQNNEHAKQRR